MVGGNSTLIGLSISKALSAMVRSMTAVAGGDSGITIRGLGRRDEIGEMAAAVGVFKDNMIDTERLRSEQTEAAQRQASQRKAEMNTLVYPTGLRERLDRSSKWCHQPRLNLRIQQLH